MTNNLIELTSFQNYLRSNNLLYEELKINLYTGSCIFAHFGIQITIDFNKESICFLDDLITQKPYLRQAYIKTDFKFVEPYLEFKWKEFIVKVNDKK